MEAVVAMAEEVAGTASHQPRGADTNPRTPSPRPPHWALKSFIHLLVMLMLMISLRSAPLTRVSRFRFRRLQLQNRVELRRHSS